MATGGFQVHDQEGKKLICELCDTKVDTCIYKCLDCDVYMCDNCTKAHNRVKETRDHKILKDQHGPLPPSRAESKCTSHPGEDVMFYCYTCQIFICSFCITGNHSNHKCSMIKQASEGMSAELRDHLSHLKDNHITVLRSHVKRFENLQTSNKEQHESNVKNIQAQTDTIIQEIKNVQIMLIQESEKTTNENKSRLSELQDNVTKKVEELESKYLDFNKDLTSGCDIDKIMARNEVLELLEKYQLPVQQAKIYHSEFVPGEIDVTPIKKSFGLIEVVEGDTSDNDFFHTEKVKSDKSANTLSNAEDLKDVSTPQQTTPAKADKELAPATFSNEIPVKDAPTTTKLESENDNSTTDKVPSSDGSKTPTLHTDQDNTGYNNNKADIARTSKISSDTATSSVTFPDITLNIISKFKHKSTPVRCICPVSDTTAYLGCECSIDKVDKNGQVQGSIKLDFKVYDFVFTSEGDFICTVNGSKNMFKVTKDGQIKQQLYTGPLHPECLCLSIDGHILVTMCYRWPHDVNMIKRRCIIKMTTTGQILTVYHYDNDQMFSFNLSCGIDENTNKDICVLKRTSMNSGDVVILNASGGLKCTYKGQESEMFCPLRVKCDEFGHIIVSDFYKKIHILNGNGQLIKY